MATGRQKTALHKSPFFILGATPRDNRARIVELAEERSLTGDADAFDAARSTLSSPRTRLSAEMSWLPGLSPSRAAQFLTIVENRPIELIDNDAVPPLAKSNAISAVFEYIDERHPVELIVRLINSLAKASQEIRAQDVLRDINEDRAVSGFPELRNIEDIEAEISARIREYSKSVTNSLDRIPTMKLVATIGQLAGSGIQSRDTLPPLIEEIIDDYTLETQTFFSLQAKSIDELIELIRSDAQSGKSTSEQVFQLLKQSLDNWKLVADPILEVAKIRGTNHDVSASLAYSLRSLSLDLFNNHDMLERSTWLTELIASTFDEMAAIADSIEADKTALADIQLQRQMSAHEKVEFEKELAYEVKLGVFKNQTFSISATGIKWNSEEYSLNEITRARWGAVRNSRNGIPTGTDYVVAFGSNNRESVIRFSNNDSVFQAITTRLWKAFAVRIMTTMIQTVKRGDSVRFGNGVLKNSGMLFMRHKLLEKGELVEVPWDKIVIYSQSGTLYLKHKDDKGLSLSLSYIEDANAHFLEQVIRTFFKDSDARSIGDLIN